MVAKSAMLIFDLDERETRRTRNKSSKTEAMDWHHCMTQRDVPLQVIEDPSDDHNQRQALTGRQVGAGVRTSELFMKNDSSLLTEVLLKRTILLFVTISKKK